jgi:hypothetical protein
MRKFFSLLSLGLVTIFGSMIGSVVSSRAAEAGSVSAVYTTQDTAEFRTLAKATVEALDAGKTTEMVAKLTDLETAWDAKEKTLKPKNPGTWETLDKTLDKAISALRSSKTNLPKGKAALEDFQKKLAQATKS